MKETINDWVLEATQDPDFIALLEGAGTSVKYRTPEQMDADINKNTARYTQIIRDNNIQK